MRLMPLPATGLFLILRSLHSGGQQEGRWVGKTYRNNRVWRRGKGCSLQLQSGRQDMASRLGTSALTPAGGS